MSSKLNTFRRVAAALFIMAGVVSCSTQKATWSNIQFHNTTTHYNIWWNGNESLKQGLKQLNTNVKDDYTQILPVYKVGTKEECASLSPQFDRAVEKGIKGIKKHSIFVDGREHVPYVPKCYLLTSYATFYKHDYTTTASTCQMLTIQYAGTAVADEAAILQARCSALDGRLVDAETALDELVAANGKGNFAPSQRLNLFLAMAECTLPQEKYKKGVNFLKQALDEHPTQQQKARIYFILGQIYQTLDKRPTASKYYEKVLQCSPDYEMEFNARLNMASCADLQHTDKAKLERLLDKMIKDKKNEEFLDQVWYAKGEMYMGFREVKKACDAFKTSCAVSKNNPAQKARSALRLGSILYDKYQDYDQAQLYYDTAVNNIRPTYPHYKDIKSRYDILTQLVAYTRVIDYNDSIIAVANMPEKERLTLINGKIEQLVKEEEAAKERELLEQISNDSKAQQNTLTGDWYFYNANTVQKGKESFRKQWGMRALEDYWFLSKKGLLGMSSMLSGDADDSVADDDQVTDADTAANAEGVKKDKKDKKDSDPSGDPNDPHNVAYYLKDLPTTPEMQDSLRSQISTCLLNAGYIYYDGVHNIPKALECYLRMTKDFTEDPEIVQAFFMLYKVYDKQGNTPSSNYYRDMVLMGFPDSDFSNLILDEDYYKEIIRRSQLINEDYEEVYALYRRHRYDDVISNVATAKELYAGNSMLGKFSYWEALSYAKKDNKKMAVNILQNIVKSYPQTDTIVPLAQLQLDYLLGDDAADILSTGADSAMAVAEDVLSPETLDKRREGLAQIGSNKGDEDSELPAEAKLFRYRENLPHLVIIIVKDKKIRATQLQLKISDFNGVYYSNISYKVSPLMFTDSTQLVSISTFNNAGDAMDYCRHLCRSESPLSQYNSGDYQIFAISKQNYATFYNRKDVWAYQLFYDKYYNQ